MFAGALNPSSSLFSICGGGASFLGGFMISFFGDPLRALYGELASDYLVSGFAR